jgi:hypothetical protein
MPPHPNPLPAGGARERAAFAEPLSMNSDKFITAASSFLARDRVRREIDDVATSSANMIRILKLLN